MRIAVALSLLISLAFPAGMAWAVERHWCGVYGTSEVEIKPNEFAGGVKPFSS